MKKGIMVIASVVTLVTACADGNPTAPASLRASSSPSASIEPGIPGTSNCSGQTHRFVAQGDNGLADTHGIGGLASLANLTTDQLNAFIDQYCAGN